MNQSVKIGLIQLEASENKDENISRTFLKIKEAANNGAQIICTQEMFTTTYFCRTHNEDFFDYADPIPGKFTEELDSLAGKLGVVIIASFFEKRAKGIYHNSATVHDADGTFLGLYRKMHIPEDPGFHEKFYFTPGDLGYKVFDTHFGKIGVLICWDQWFPEAARLTALKGADILFYPTAIGVLPNEGAELKKEFMDAWEITHRGHSVANGCYVAAVNRVGQEGDSTFWGDSFVCGPFGQIIAKAGDKETILYADVNFSLIEKQRRTWPFLRDRRIDSFSSITKRMEE